MDNPSLTHCQYGYGSSQEDKPLYSLMILNSCLIKSNYVNYVFKTPDQHNGAFLRLGVGGRYREVTHILA